MKKLFLLPLITFFSCGPSEADLAKAKQDFLQSVDSLQTKLAAQVQDYCDCLEKQTVDICKGKHDAWFATWREIDNRAGQAHKHKISVKQTMAMRDNAAREWDKSAKHYREAKDRDDAAAYGIILHKEEEPVAETKAEEKTSTNPKKAVTPKKTEKINEEEEHHHEEKQESTY